MQTQSNAVGKLSSLAALLATGFFLAQGQATAIENKSLAINEGSALSELAADNLDGVSELKVPTSFKIASTENLDVTSINSGLQEDNLGVVTSVSQLSDVQPTDWAFQALQSLVERYGCIAGYPDGTFRGNRAATRYEMAAALNACLDNISDKFATKEDLEAVKALQEEFQAELATLRGRVDGLEARTATLEAQQFSTTTKLQADAVFLAQFGDTSGNQLPIDIDGDGTAEYADPGDARASAIAAVYMSFNTSFSGDDLLQTTLFFGNGGSDTISNFPVGLTPTFPSAGGNVNDALFNPGQLYFAGVPNTALLYRLAYDFSPVDDVTIKVAPLFYPTDVIDANSYTSPFTGLSTWSSINNPLITPYHFNFLGGAGGAVTWNPSEGPVTARAVYVASTGQNAVDLAPAGAQPAGQNGLFGAPFQATGELEYANTFGDNNNFAVRGQYTYFDQNFTQAHVVGLNAEVTLGQFGLYGRYGYAFADSQNQVNPLPFSQASGDAAGVNNVGRFDAQTFQAGIAFNDLVVPGSTLGAAVTVPFLVSDSDFPRAGTVAGVNDQTQFNIEGYYRLPVNDNISITPAVQVILNPNNSSLTRDIYQGLIRTVFSF
ncbi:MAG: iron uptake porin [Acaryochloridaceae cyanobacterium RL_2_7]|nr:iron uptake porin [Acaryochloridaceae cyanobacterium RL_2_7]